MSPSLETPPPADESAPVVATGPSKQDPSPAAVPGLVFTNGCFDLFHAGHVALLQACRRYGNKLIVGLNSDRSVKAIKGPSRPICNQRERLAVLVACRFVDEVWLFDEPTPCALIAQLRPKVIIKGHGYAIEEMPEAHTAQQYGASIIVLGSLMTISTTALINRIQSLPNNK